MHSMGGITKIKNSQELVKNTHTSRPILVHLRQNPVKGL